MIAQERDFRRKRSMSSWNDVVLTPKVAGSNRAPQPDPLANFRRAIVRQVLVSLAQVISAGSRSIALEHALLRPKRFRGYAGVTAEACRNLQRTLYCGQWSTCVLRRIVGARVHHVCTMTCVNGDRVWQLVSCDKKNNSVGRGHCHIVRVGGSLTRGNRNPRHHPQTARTRGFDAEESVPCNKNRACAFA